MQLGFVALQKSTLNGADLVGLQMIITPLRLMLDSDWFRHQHKGN